MDKIMMTSHAKVNLLLDVVGKREDGYHDIRTIMQQCGLCDTITLETASSGIGVVTNLSYLPTDHRNIAYKSAKAFFDHTGLPCGVKIGIVKRIPVCAGLAGGSGNAAAVLLGLNSLLKTNLSMETLLQLGKGLGADVPYCILGGTMLSEGIGDVLTSLPPLRRTPIVIVKPPISVSTASVYREIDGSDGIDSDGFRHPDIDSMLEAIKKKDIRAVGAKMENVMEMVTVKRYPVIREIKDLLLKSGAIGAIMSGSGSSVFGLFENYAAAKKAGARFNRRDFFVYAGWTN